MSQGDQNEQDYWQVPRALDKRMHEAARDLRQHATPSEQILWLALRNRQLAGYKFRRQVPIGPFIVDFLCTASRLIVEVDGGIHTQQIEADRERQQLLESLGFRVLRISAEVVESDVDAALVLIKQALERVEG